MLANALLIFGLIISGVLIQVGILTNSTLENGFNCYIGSSTITPHAATASTTGPPSMDVTSGDSYYYLNPNRETYVTEKVVSASSELYTLPSTGINVTLAKVGLPRGNITYGVFDNTGTVVKTFGILNASSLTTSDASYVKTGIEYDLATGDRIGIKYTAVNGTGNYAVKFDGINGVVNATNNSKLQVGEVQGSAAAYLFYFKADTTPASEADLMSKGGITPFITSGGNLQFDIKYQNIGNSFSNTIKNGVIDGKWHQVIIQASNVTGLTQAYYDGSLVYNTTAKDYLRSTSGTRLLIGAAPTGSTQTAASPVTMDRVGVYANKTFSQSEVTSLWNGASITTGLQLMYQFNEGSGSTVADSSGNGIDGTLYGGYTWVGSYVGDLVRIGINTTNPFDGTTSILSKYGNSVWTDVSGEDVWQAITVTTEPASNTLDGSTSSYWANGQVQESGAYIYFDMGLATSINQVKITLPNTAFIPSSVQVFVSNNPSAWGTAIGTYTLSQSTGQQTLSLSTDTSIVGRYVKVQVDTWGTAKYWRLSETTTTAADTSSQAYQSCQSVRDNVWLILNISSYGLIFAGLFVIFQPVLGRFGGSA